MTEDLFQGYKGEALKVLQTYKVRVWGQADIETTRGLFRGTVLPRSENNDDLHIVIKIESGYNIGIDITTITRMAETGYNKANYKIPEKAFPYSDDKPNVKLLGTGDSRFFTRRAVRCRA
jgi:glutamyl-tRNA(Gln) amidotransferase subunit D